jgi:hypothetical protein
MKQYLFCSLWVVVAVGGAGMIGGGCSAGDPTTAGRRGDPVSPVPPVVAGTGGAAAPAGSGPPGTAGTFDNNSGAPIERMPTGIAGSDDSAPDQPMDCGGTELEPTVVMSVVRGNVLVVFDQSLSMNERWNGGGSKWSVATKAVSDALTPLQGQINAGSLFFPNGGGFDGCGVQAIDSGKQIGFQPGEQFVSAWSAYLGNNDPGGFTPTGTAVELADSALHDATLSGTTAVVIITDGDPNCGTNDSQVNQYAAGWLVKGIKTYVIGLPGADAGANRLDALAAAGGTQNYLVPTDSAGLQTALATIVGSSVSSTIDTCRIDLPYRPPNLDDVTLVVVQEGVKQSVARDLGSSGGWTLDADSLEITMNGALCEQAKLGTYSKISVVFGCADLPPLPPPPSPF